MKARVIVRSAVLGMAVAALQVSLYLTVISLLANRAYAFEQFASLWYYIVPLAIGIGIQVGLYSYLRGTIRQGGSSGKVIAVSGATSSVAMVSCCLPHLAGMLPVIGITSLASTISQYQTQFFWLGLALNLGGIAYISRMIFKFHRSAKTCAA